MVDLLKGLDARALGEVTDPCDWARYKEGERAGRAAGAHPPSIPHTNSRIWRRTCALTHTRESKLFADSHGGRKRG